MTLHKATRVTRVVHRALIQEAVWPSKPRFYSAFFRRAFQDPRAQLYWHVLRLAKARQPTALLLENVTGLVSNPAVFAAVLRELAAVGYRVRHFPGRFSSC